MSPFAATDARDAADRTAAPPVAATVAPSAPPVGAAFSSMEVSA